MRQETPFNPLDKKNLGVSVADALLERDFSPLPPDAPFIGAGIYAIYYRGPHPAYQAVVERTQDGLPAVPIYVGKAVPAGARKGGFGLGISPGMVLYKRLREHAKSIEEAQNVELSDFLCRYLVVDDIWIPLGESLLIESYAPAWNKVIDGFGNHDPGGGRRNQQRSAWDVLHPGRVWAKLLKPNVKSEEDIINNLQLFLAGEPSETIPENTCEDE